MPWGPLLAGALSGIGGYIGGRNQRKAAEQANRPQPFWEHSERAPWDPAAHRLSQVPEIAYSDFMRARRFRPPPGRSSVRGPSSQMRGLVDAIRNRAMTSTFIPDMQSRALEMATSPNPFMEQVFKRAGNYQNPALSRMLERGLSGGIGGSRMLRGVLENLIGGQERLGEPMAMRPEPVPQLPTKPLFMRPPPAWQPPPM